MNELDKKAPLRIRGHSLLCFQGFRGLGYNPEFIANMKDIHERLQKNPEILIEPTSSPDILCQSCPNLNLGDNPGCVLHGPGTEVDMVAQDQEVLDRLGLTPNKPISWSMILKRISQKIDGRDLPAICGKCPWLKLGYCAEGIDALEKA